jgi:metallophosphoesterase (TIGR03767 family)
MSPRLLLGAALVALAFAPTAAADTTLRHRIQPAAGSGYRALDTVKGEKYVVRRGAGAKAHHSRARHRRSLGLFAQLTDPQIADEMSPARVDFADPAGGEIKSSWRPQEALGLQVFDSIVRAVNANRRSPVKQGNGKRARLAFALTTGDLADNQQLNETRWFRTVLDGGTVDPFSGKPIGAGNPCGSASASQAAAINADVAARRYTGVADYDDYASAPDSRKAGFWDPDVAPPGNAGQYAVFPRYPGLLERAQASFKAVGLKVPWYISRGNHDGLIQGNAPASTDLFRAIAVGCLKVFPSAVFDPSVYAGKSADELFAAFNNPTFIAQLLASGRAVAPDPDRQIISKRAYRALMTGKRRHGFAFTPKKQLAASRGTASYYAFSPRRGLRFISLDTVAEGGGQNGNLDDPQYRWLKGELAKEHKRHRLVVVFGHHTMETMDNARADEDAGACQPADEPGCDRDPRKSTPIHRGVVGKRSVSALLEGTPNVVAYVAGHTHANRVRFFRGRRGHGFWQINTASHIDWPEQARLIEIMDNRDGTLSLFGTLIDSAAPAAAPPPGPAAAFSPTQLASLARTLAFNDPQDTGLEGSAGGGSKAGTRKDRNVELVVRDPR